MRRVSILLVLLLAASLAASTQGLPRKLMKVAFGSCANQFKPQPILTRIAREESDLMIYLGDNIYADTRDIDKIREYYRVLAAKPEFQLLRASTPMLSTWDDHDLGENDVGKNYPKLAESREIFLDFWRVPLDSPRRAHPGVYHSEMFGGRGTNVQLILLDTRSFRDDHYYSHRLWRAEHTYDAHPVDSNATVLGEQQWKWLEAELRRPAVFRIIASSIQFSHQLNGYESWTLYPGDRLRLVELLKETHAEGAFIISGDVHWGEFSVAHFDGMYPLYDATSSGITETWPHVAPNNNRIGAPEPLNNYGLLHFNWTTADPEVTFEIKTVDGKASISHTLRHSELTFPDSSPESVP
jgi:alkaline phosphatase D